MQSLRNVLLGLLMLAVTSAGCSPQAPAVGSGDQPLKTPAVQLLLNWYPEAEHGGYYAALVHGYFAEAGLDVTIVPGGPNSPVLQKVAGGDLQFGIENADRILLGRAAEADVVAVMAPIQQSPRCILVHRASGIKSFNELKGIKLAIGSGAAWAEYFKKYVDLSGVELVPYTGNIGPFLNDPKFAQQAYVFSEPFLAEKQKSDPHTLMVSELGYNPYTSVLIARGDMIRNDPELVKKMVTACVKGWKKYLESPDETNAHIAKINPQMERDVLDYGARALKPLCEVAEKPGDVGNMTADRWTALAAQLEEVGAIKKGTVDPKLAFSTVFLPNP